MASIALPVGIGALSGYLTSGEISTWFTTLEKPVFNPPSWVFAPVWTTLYVLMGISLFLVWNSLPHPLHKRAYFVFGSQLLLNFLWSLFFFSFHLLLVSLADIVLLWILIFSMIKTFRQINPWAGYLQVPYLLWVSFATLLNLAFWWLNR